MATAEEYASWIVSNADKKGTPEFDTVAKAYQIARTAPPDEGPPPAQAQPPLAQRAISAVSAQPGEYGIPRNVVQGVASAILPGALGGLGALGGVATAPFTGGIVNPVTLGAAGAAGGEALNQQLGITEPSAAMIGINALGPVAGKAATYIKPALRGLGQRLPGAAQVLEERAAPLAADISTIGAPMPTQPSKVLYDELAKHDPYIDATPFRDQLVKMQGEVMNRLGESPKKESLLRYLDSKINAIDKTPTGNIPFRQLRATQKEINGLIGAKDSGEDLGVLNQLAKGIKESLEQAADSRFAGAGVPEQVALLKRANTTYVMEQGKEALDKALIGRSPELEGGVRTFSDKARQGIKKVLDSNDDVKAAYPAVVRNQMKDALDAIGPLPSNVSSIHSMTGTMLDRTIGDAIRAVVMSPEGRQKLIAWTLATGHKAPPDIVSKIAASLTGGISHPALGAGAIGAATGIMNPAQGQIQSP